MAEFNFEATGGAGRFKLPGGGSIFQDGAEFTVKKAVVGVWKDASGKIVNEDGAESIRLETSLSSAEGDLLNLNRLLRKSWVVYNDSGRASLLYSCAFREELLAYLDRTFGRDQADKRFLVGTAKEIGEKLVSEFFAGKTVTCREEKDVFFKEVKDGVETLNKPYSPVVTFHWK